MATNHVHSMDDMTAFLGLLIDEEPVASLCAGCKRKQWPFVMARYRISRIRGFEIKYGPDRVVETIFLKSFGRNGYAQFAGKLPNGIKFGDPTEKVHAALGKPTRSGSLGVSVPGVFEGWDRYEYPRHRVHFSYAEDGRLDLIMLMLTRDRNRKRPKDKV